MSVIFKGMEKPPECEWLDKKHNKHRCPLLVDDNDCKLQDCDPDWSWEEQYKGCPLIDIPEGARLIDANVLCKDLTRFYDNEVTAISLIYEQPTIFEED